MSCNSEKTEINSNLLESCTKCNLALIIAIFSIPLIFKFKTSDLKKSSNSLNYQHKTSQFMQVINK